MHGSQPNAKQTNATQRATRATTIFYSQESQVAVLCFLALLKEGIFYHQGTQAVEKSFNPANLGRGPAPLLCLI